MSKGTDMGKWAGCICPSGFPLVSSKSLGKEARAICNVYQVWPPSLSILMHALPCTLPDELLAVLIPKGLPVA